MPCAGFTVSSPWLRTVGYAVSSNHPLTQGLLLDRGKSVQTDQHREAQCGSRAPRTVLRRRSEPQWAPQPCGPILWAAPCVQGLPGPRSFSQGRTVSEWN